MRLSKVKIMKKMKEKYGNQDEEERNIRMALLASAGKVQKNDGDPQNENASTHKEKKPAISPVDAPKVCYKCKKAGHLSKDCKEHPDDILFIDASQHFEKVKTQNYLRDEDVDRIVDTFSKRITIDKYSYVASLGEVRENDYNLNIPRYVDTFEEEESVDISGVASELKELETEIQNTDETIAEYCRELNIPTPF